LYTRAAEFTWSETANNEVRIIIRNRQTPVDAIVRAERMGLRQMFRKI
jgi:hypothetical protein